jgi:hypothetical protein
MNVEYSSSGVKFQIRLHDGWAPRHNRYVEGLGTRQAADQEYEPMGRRLRDQGYVPNP